MKLSTDVIYACAALASAVAAVLAWVAKIHWSKEYRLAKDEIIRAKDAQVDVLKREVEGLRELTPMKIREYFLSVKRQLEAYNDELRSELDRAKGAIQERDHQIVALRSEGSARTTEIQKIEEERASIKLAHDKLQAQLDELQEKYEGDDAFTLRIPKVDPRALEEIQSSLQELRNSWVHNIPFPKHTVNPEMWAKMMSKADDLSKFPFFPNWPEHPNGSRKKKDD